MSNMIPGVTSEPTTITICTQWQFYMFRNLACVTMKLLNSTTNQTEWEGVHLPVWLMHQVRVTEPTYIYLKNTIDNFSPIYEFVLN